MKFIRENLFLIILAGIVLLGGGGMVAYYFKVSGQVSDAIDERAAMARTLKNLETRGANAEMEAAAEERIAAIEAAADEVKEMCLEWNRSHMQVLQLRVPHSQMSVPAFPYDEQLYRDQGLGYVFTKTYVEAMDALRNSLRPTSPPTEGEVQSQVLQWENRLMQWKLLEAGQSPSPATGYRMEEEDEYYDRPGSLTTLTPLPSPQPTDPYGMARPAFSSNADPSVAAQAMIRGRESAMLIKARRGAVYMDPSALDMVFTEAIPNPSVVDLWQAQLNLWVTSDIVAAINGTNDEAYAEGAAQDAPRDVLTSAVKRLALINVNENYVTPVIERAPMARRGGRYPDEEYEAEEYDYSVGQAQGRENASVLTQRGSTQEYDIVRYRLVVVMASRHLPLLQRHLLARNYHTILSVQIRPPDAPVPTAGAVMMAYASPLTSSNYYYGPEPVVQVEIEGEVLLLTDWVRGTWDGQADAWSEQFPPLIPVEALMNQYRQDSPALRSVDMQRYPEETDEMDLGYF